MTAPNSDCAIDLNAVALDRRPQPAGQQRSGAMYLAACGLTTSAQALAIRVKRWNRRIVFHSAIGL